MKLFKLLLFHSLLLALDHAGKCHSPNCLSVHCNRWKRLFPNLTFKIIKSSKWDFRSLAKINFQNIILFIVNSSVMRKLHGFLLYVQDILEENFIQYKNARNFDYSTFWITSTYCLLLLNFWRSSNCLFLFESSNIQTTTV